MKAVSCWSFHWQWLGKSINKRQNSNNHINVGLCPVLWTSLFYISEITADSDALATLASKLDFKERTRRSDLHNQWDEWELQERMNSCHRINTTVVLKVHFTRIRLGIGPYNQAVLLHQGGIGTGSIRPCKNIFVFSQKKGNSSFFLVWRLQPSAEGAARLTNLFD